jgi:hypothetical protein
VNGISSLKQRHYTFTREQVKFYNQDMYTFAGRRNPPKPGEIITGQKSGSKNQDSRRHSSAYRRKPKIAADSKMGTDAAVVARNDSVADRRPFHEHSPILRPLCSLSLQILHSQIRRAFLILVGTANEAFQLILERVVELYCMGTGSSVAV